MNMLKMIFRDSHKMEVEFIQTWEVRWTSRYGDYSGDTRGEVRIFMSKDDASAFGDALSDAFKLIKHTHNNKIIISKVKE